MDPRQPARQGLARWLQRLLLAVLTCLPVLAAAVVRDHYFSRFDGRHGLSESSVTAMFQGRDGFIWIATSGNLHRFDGYSFQTLDELIVGAVNLPGTVETLSEDEQGRIYVGTYPAGLFRVDIAGQRVDAFPPPDGELAWPGKRIDALLYQPGVGLWVGDESGLGLLDPDGLHYQLIAPFDASAGDAGAAPPQREKVQALALDRDDVLWVGSSRALLRIEPETHAARRFSESAVASLLVDAGGTLWLGSAEGLQQKARNATQPSLVWGAERDQGRGACCEPIALAQAGDGSLWLSVRGGSIWHYDPVSREAEKIRANPWIDGSPEERGIAHLMVDRSDVLWLGGEVRGLAVTPAGRSAFQTVYDLELQRDPLADNFITATYEDEEGALWLGSRGGLRRYDPAHDRFEYFDDLFAAQDAGTEAPIVSAIAPVGDGRLWLATQIGLYRLDPHARVLEAMPLLGSLTPVKISAMARLRDGNLWLALEERGLVLHDSVLDRCTLLPEQPAADAPGLPARITTIMEDSRRRIWVGTMQGLNLFDPASGRLRRFRHDPARADSLSSDIVLALLEARDGTLWVGGQHGLAQILESTDDEIGFRAWPQPEAYRELIVHAIAEDGHGRLWLAGDSGLARLDRGDGTWLRFGLGDGLQSLAFNAGASTVLRNGHLAFGGVRGLNLVDPARIATSQFDAPVVVTWATLGRTGPIPQPALPKSLVVPAQERSLRLGLAALDYTAPQDNQFSYFLEGFDADFSPPTIRPWVNYAKLPPGNYVLRIRATNHSGVWSSNELRIPVEVLTPWWRSAWMIALYAVAAMALLLALVLLQRRRAAQRAALLAQVREREDRLKLSLWGAGDSFWDWDLRNNRMHRIGGEQLLHTPITEELTIADWRNNAIHPDDLARVQNLMQEHLIGRSEAYESEHRLRNAHGEWVWVRARGKVVERDSGGNPLRVAGTARDISSTRQSERERRIASEVLRGMNEAVAVVDLNFRFVSVNPAFSRTTGYQERDVIGMPDTLLESSRHPPEFLRRMHEELRDQGRYKGELWLRRADGDEFLSWIEITEVRDETDQRTHYVAVLNDITDRKRAEQELRYLANYDTLTGLPNRSLLAERLARAVVRARRHGHKVAVLFLDLDHFKIINDSLGHAAGDRILKVAAARLLGVVGSGDTVARLGGDEFTIVMEDVVDPVSVAALARAVIASFGAPVLNDVQGEVVISPSIGISLYPDHAQVPVDLLKYADVAMYRAKERGRNTFQFYDESMDAEIRRRATMTAALRRALDRNEFHLEFQPRQALFGGHIPGVEALLRWTSEEFGAVPPSVFIPLAEESGLILTLGEWVMEEACRTLQQWREHGVTETGVAVNVSVLQLLRGGLTESVTRVLERTGLPASRLELELTESMVMANAEQTINTLRELKRLGVNIAIDDFGTGYSSLIYLKRLPIDTLKIDKEFVGDLTHDPDDEAIVATIISMAHSLGLNVVAEGVETPEQLHYLRDQGCDEIQGYLLSRPLRAPDCLAFLQARIDQPDNLTTG